MKFDVVSLGPVRMDCFVGLDENEVTEICSIDKQACTISLGFGDKIPVKTMHFAIGGNTGNNAVGLARLGFKTAVVGTMGGEWVDERALGILKNEGVNVDNLTTVVGQFGFGVVIGYQGERTILSYYPDIECKFEIKDSEMETKWMYMTTAGENYEEFYDQALKWAMEKQVKIAFNPGSRQLRDGVNKLGRVMAAAEIMFVNKEEGEALLEVQGGEYRTEETVKNLLKLGPKVVVVTDGEAGAWCGNNEKMWHMPIVPAKVVEKTGAGDAFGSGFMAAYVAGKTIDEALKWGACNSAAVLEYVGPQEGLLTTSKMAERLENNVVVEAREIY